MSWKRKTLLLTAAAALTFAGGCAGNDKLKENVGQSLTKQTEMKTYSFSGLANLEFNPAEQSAANPLTAGLIGMFTKSKLEWSGTASTDPVRFEADIKSTPSGSAAPLQIPVIFKDNKLFVSLPLLNKKDEYFAIDINQSGSGSAQENPLSPESLKNLTKSTSEITRLSIEGIKEKWFKKSDDVTLKDGSKGTVVQVEITDKNKKELSDAWKAKFPEILGTLQANGILTAAQADKMKKQGSSSFELKAPGLLSFTIDSEGFIREETIKLSYAVTGPDGKVHDKKLELTQGFDEINKAPKFTKDEPKAIRPIGDILKLLKK